MIQQKNKKEKQFVKNVKTLDIYKIKKFINSTYKTINN